MPRRSRIIAKGVPHHVVQRGNFRQNVFETFEEFRQYCYFVREYQEKYGLEIISYCLMNNHVHFIVTPLHMDSLGKYFRTVHMRYSQFKNHIEKRKGHLWQGRFFSSILDNEYLFKAIRYVERNPVRAKMIKHPWDYSWSSARARIGLDHDQIIRINPNIAGQKMSQQEWKGFLLENNETQENLIRHNTEKGYAIGNEHFIVKMEEQLQTNLRERKPGRPKK